MIIEFLLDGIISKYIEIYPVLTLLSLIFLKTNYKYLLVIIVGLLYDITYTDTLFLNTSIFFLLLYFIKYYLQKFKYNLFNLIILSILLILIYRTSTYLILIIFSYKKFDIYNYLFSMLYSFISIIYVFIRYIHKKMI